MQNTNGNTHSSALAVGFAIGIAALGALALTSVVAITGCGGSSGGSSVAESTTPATDQIAVAASPAIATPPASPGTPLVALGDSLPPDVMVTVEDSTAAPGGVVSITAVGSDDVSQIGLSDGLARMQLFTRDPASNVWHVLYRVPIRTTKERIALSVTALNDLNRWRRVWVFVPVQQSQSEIEDHECAPDVDTASE